MDKLNGNRVDMTKEVGSMSEMGTAMGRLREVCEGEGFKIIHDASIRDGDIYVNPESKILLVEDYINENNIVPLVSLIK